MAQFMLLLYDDPTAWRKVGPEDMQKAIEKYMAWTKKPFTVDSKRLGEDAGRVIRSQGGKPRATDGPYSESKEVLGGYYTIEAKNYDRRSSARSIIRISNSAAPLKSANFTDRDRARPSLPSSGGPYRGTPDAAARSRARQPRGGRGAGGGAARRSNLALSRNAGQCRRLAVSGGAQPGH